MARLPFYKTVRARLLVIALLPVLLLMPLLLGATMRGWIAQFDDTLTAKVNSELTIAHQHLAGLIESRGAAVEALGGSWLVVRHLRGGEPLEPLLEREAGPLGFDYLLYLPAREAAQARWPVVQRAHDGERAGAIDILDQEELAALSPDLAERAIVPLVETRAAVPTDKTIEDRGMVVHVAAPAPGGVLLGGVLLNRNLGFIDEINTIVYPEASLAAGSQGTATLFLDDVRISTNVRLFEDVRALGTRVSAAVRGRVLDEGEVWLDRAFVVNDWYVSAYEPITDSFGNRVGMLYVGFLDAPYRAAERQMMIRVGAAFLIVLAVAVPLFLWLARGIFRPLERINATIGRVQQGDLGARTGTIAQDDEISRVAAQLDSLLEQLQRQNRALKDWAEELEDRVAARTADLAEANRQIETTSKQLILSEKLAAIGEITAGVAHEINNPLAVIQGNFDVIREELGARVEPLRTEFQLVQEQIQAIHILVTKLLRFARPEEYADSGGGVDPDQAIRDTLPLIQHVLTRSEIELRLDLDAGGQVRMNQTELQQVMINLMVNAIQAMPGGGRLEIVSRSDTLHGADAVRIEARDTGIGMPPEVVAKVFDPFFSTKRSEGTGLGLAVSRDLVQRAGGELGVTSEPGQGSCFTVVLPCTGKE